LSHRLELESISADNNGSRSTEKKGTICKYLMLIFCRNDLVRVYKMTVNRKRI